MAVITTNREDTLDEFRKNTNDVSTFVGDTATLDTDLTADNITDAVNEHESDLYKSTTGSFDGLSATNFKGAIEEVVDELGQVTEFASGTNNIGTDTTAVSAIKTLDSTLGNVSYTGTNNLTSETTIIGGITELDAQLGTVDWTGTNNITATDTVEQAIKTLDTDLGNVVYSGTNNLDAKTTVMGGIYELDAQIGAVDFTSTNNLNANDTVVQAIKTLSTDMGEVGFTGSNNLASQTTLTAAITELDAQLGTVDFTSTSNLNANDTVVTGITTLANKIGVVSFTGTNNIASKTTVMGGIKGNDTAIGKLTELGTDTQTTIVAAINEVEDRIGGTFAPVSGTQATIVSNVATITVASHNFEVGDKVTVVGFDTEFNGTFTITATTATTIKYAKTAANKTSATLGIIAPLRSGANDTLNAIALVENFAGYGTTLSIGDNLADGINDLNSAKLNKASASSQTLSSDIVYSGDMEVTGSISITSGQLIVAGGAGSLNLSTSYIDIGDKTLTTTPATLGVRFNRGQNTITATQDDQLLSSAIFWQESDREFYVRTPYFASPADETAGIESFDDDKIVTFRNSSDLFSNTTSTAITKSVNSSGVVTFGIANNAVALGTQTTGNYMAGVTGTANEIEVNHTAGEGSTATIGLPNSVTITNGVTAGKLLVGGATAADSDIIQQGTTNDDININLTATAITGNKKVKTNANFESAKDVKAATFTSTGKATFDSLETTGNALIKGNLEVQGTMKVTNTETIELSDNIILLNSDLLSTAVPTQSAGVEINRGSDGNVQLRWYEDTATPTASKWQVQDEAGTFRDIIHSASTLFIIKEGNGTETATVTSGETLTLAQGTGIESELTSTTSGGTITITNTDRGSSQYIFKTISARASDGTTVRGSNVVADSNTDTLIFKEGGGITLSGDGTSSISIAHTDTSSQASVNNSNGTVIQDITLDTYGHITAIGSLDGDTRWVNKTGDTMTGNLNFSDTGEGITWSMNTDGASIKFYNTGDSDTNSRLEFNTLDNGNEHFRWTTTNGSSTYELGTWKLSGTAGYLTSTGKVISPVFEGVTTAVVRAANQTTTNAEGHTTTIYGGIGNGTGSGGQLNLYGGDNTSSKGGDVYIKAGTGSSTAGTSAWIEAQAGTTTGLGGSVYIYGGQAVGTNKPGGAITLLAPKGTGTGDPAVINLQTSVPGSTGSAAHATRTSLSLAGTNSTFYSDVTVDNGTRSIVNIVSDDTGQSELNLYGSSQGTGKIFVGQSTTYGGGIGYWGDGTQTSPSFPTNFPTDTITLYNVSNGTQSWTAKNSYNSLDWVFAGDLTVEGGEVRAKSAVSTSGYDIALVGSNSATSSYNGGLARIDGGDSTGKGNGASIIAYGGYATGSPGAWSLVGGSASGTNISGSVASLIAAKGTGTGTGSIIRMQASVPTASGSTIHSLTTVAEFDHTGLDMQSKDITGVSDLYVDDQIISTGDTDTYLQFHAEDQFRVVTGGTERLEVGNTAIIAGVRIDANAGINLDDSDVLSFGTDADAEFFHNGTDMYTDINAGGNWYIRDGNSSNATRFTFDVDVGSLTTTGTIFAGGVNLSDGNSLTLGTSSDIIGTFHGASNVFSFDIASGRKFGFTNGLLDPGQTTAHFEFDGSFTTVADINIGGTLYETSDARVKENVVTIDNALDKVANLRGVNFNKIGEIETQMGVIAQEVEKVIPEVVKTNEDGEKSVAYANMVGLLIEAIKDLKSEIEEIKSKL